MIHSVSANQSSFQTVTFKTGLNVILAERTISSTDKDTRNGLGKSTLIEIIDFCLGSRPNRGKGLLIEQLEQWAFTLDMTLATVRVQVTRTVANPTCITLEGLSDAWPDEPVSDPQLTRRVLSLDQWRGLLGRALFKIPQSKTDPPYSPSFRSLISYMVRRGPDAYITPFRHFRLQAPWDVQVHVAFLLGMNWHYAVRWKVLRDREAGTKAIETAMKTGALAGVSGSIGELETQRLQLEQQFRESREGLDSFNVHPQYEFIQKEANRLTQAIHELANRNVTDRRRLARYEESIDGEQFHEPEPIERLYAECNLIFPDAVKRNLADARAFHARIIENRRHFLESEMGRLRQQIDKTENTIGQLSTERADLMQVLQTHGALQEMIKMQESHAALQGELEQIKTRLSEMKSLKETKQEIKGERVALAQSAERDHDERRSAWSVAVNLFNDNSLALYKSPGRLIIDVTDGGYEFKVDIERSGSEGIEKMKIFCFDLAVLQLQMQSVQGLDFLIHDTPMYDSVDGRQRAHAMERAHQVTSKLGGQYICTINSDMVPTADFSSDFTFSDHVRLTLTDKTPAGSLLGFYFDRTAKQE